MRSKQIASHFSSCLPFHLHWSPFQIHLLPFSPSLYQGQAPPRCRPVLPTLIFLKALLLCLLYFPFKLQESDEPAIPSSFLFTTCSVLIPPPGTQSPHHNTGHSLCPQAVPSNSSKDESPKPWHHGDSSPKGEQSTGKPCVLAGILALLWGICIYISLHHYLSL